LIKSLKTILKMDDKALGDVEIADHAGGAILDSDVGGNMTRDEGEMAFYGKKAQLKVRVLNGPAAAMPRD
jgi:threonyl-tRNA synthetase